MKRPEPGVCLVWPGNSKEASAAGGGRGEGRRGGVRVEMHQDD